MTLAAAYKMGTLPTTFFFPPTTAMADKLERMILQSLKFLNTNLQAFEPGGSDAHREISGELEALKRHLSELTPGKSSRIVAN